MNVARTAPALLLLASLCLPAATRAESPDSAAPPPAATRLLDGPAVRTLAPQQAQALQVAAAASSATTTARGRPVDTAPFGGEPPTYMLVLATLAAVVFISTRRSRRED